MAQTWGSLAEVCHDLVANEWALPTECPGWSVQDQLSHLIGVERMVMGQAAPAWDAALGQHVKNDFAAMNEPWVAVRRAWEGDAVLAEFNEVTQQRLAALAALSDEEWAVVGFSPVGQVPYARFMETRVFDSWVHEQDVRVALDRPGGMAGAAAEVGLGEIQRAMGFVVGKKAAAPEGSVVRFVITDPGPAARRFSIGVHGGRAEPLPGDGADGEAGVTLTMSAVDFVRLGCGRVEGAQAVAAGSIGVEGDAALAQAVLDNMNFMF
jgi:uncharacterized protein (TIGR03083 family)